MTSYLSAYDNFNLALAAVQLAESTGKSQSTINRKWQLYFKAEDALKMASGKWSR